jgi:carboxypeptidase C (cathepsin A)
MKILTAGWATACVAAISVLQGCASTAQSMTVPRRQPGQLEQSAVANGFPASPGGYFSTATSTTHDTVRVEGGSIPYRAVAGRIIVHGPDRHDAGDPDPDRKGGAKDVSSEAGMFYVAYLEDGANVSQRPLTFLFNGGPGSSTLWLHVGGLGPQRVVTVGQSGTSASAFRLAANQFSLLDASDLVFVDAPGTGFGRIRGKNAAKAFYGVDSDVRAFAEFITEFLSKYDRWNSPKYLVGEGYGAARAAALVNVLGTRNNIEFNGIILLSPALNFEVSGGVGALDPFNAGLDLPYELALPSFAAAAWYHHKLPGGREPLEPLLEKVERFALADYARALRQGSLLTAGVRASVAEHLHEFTGLPIPYIESANLRIDSGEFEQELLGESGVTVSQLDSRVTGPALDPLSERGGYDSEGAAGGTGYVSAFNHYVRQTLRYGFGMTYEPDISVVDQWNFWHTPPGQSDPVQQWANVMPDLANAMKYAPGLKVMVNGGYFDLATPFMTGSYEMHHLQIPPRLQSNIQYHYYRAGHLARVPAPALESLHDNIAAFIDATDHPGTAASK